MTRKTDCALAPRQCRLDKFASDDFDPRFRSAEVEFVEMGILRNRAAQIVANLAQDIFDFGGWTIGVCGAQIESPAFGNGEAVKNRPADETAHRRRTIETEHAKEPDEEKEERGLDDVTKFA